MSSEIDLCYNFENINNFFVFWNWEHFQQYSKLFSTYVQYSQKVNTLSTFGLYKQVNIY